MREFTPRALVMGTLLGMVFGASSLYLVLKVGLTVSASIPVAVISLALFRLWSKFGGRDATILENNIVQTAGSAGESIAFGLGVTMPAIMILGFDLEITRVMLVGLLGGLLGILMMIPLRRALIVAQHKQLKYPEGTACAEVLKAGADSESRSLASDAARAEAAAAAKRGGLTLPNARAVFIGFGIGLVYNVMMKALKLWKDEPGKVFGPPLKDGSVACEITPELLGVGYVIGPRIGGIMMAGGALSYLLLIPLIKFFGEGLTTALAPGSKLISAMSAGEIRSSYILYIGAGAVTAGGLISLGRSLPTILHGIRSGLADLRKAAVAHTSVLRTERDLSMKFVGGGILALILAILAAPALHMNLLGAVLIVIFGFLFVTVSSRLTGEIGSSSNPISGMTIATLLFTCLIFLLVGWTGGAHYVTALSVGGIVCIASSNGGSTSQDLKTGFLVGGTPRYQQIAILIGAAASALVLGPLLLKLNSASVVYVPAEKLEAGLHAPPGLNLTKTEGLVGPQAKADARVYKVWQRTNTVHGNAEKYLVDDTGAAVWYVDPGINGTHKSRPDGSIVQKYDAPKVQLVSYIVKGILDQKLPWALVLFGAMISIVLELCGVGSLAFAVGVYLPISSSAPIFIGGLIRWLVDRKLRHELREHKLDEQQLAAEGDKSSGVLLASGYIAGGAIAGIVIAFVQGVAVEFYSKREAWAKTNPFHTGDNADWLALIPFGLLTVFLLLVGRGTLLKSKPS
jgi:putative OPT family oligopeptide transporter